MSKPMLNNGKWLIQDIFDAFKSTKTIKLNKSKGKRARRRHAH